MMAAATATGNADNYMNVINNLRDEKLKIETTAKEAIEKIIVEKNALSQQLDDLRVLYSNLTEEHTQVCKMNEENRERILGLVEHNQELGTKLEASENQLSELKRKQAETQAEMEADKAATEKLVQEHNDKANNYNAQVRLHFYSQFRISQIFERFNLFLIYFFSS